MPFVRPVIRSLFSVLMVTIGLFGATVTDEFFWLFISIVVLGAISALLAILDERQLRQDRREAKEMRADIQTLVERLPAGNIPAHLQNLAGLSNGQIKTALLTFIGRANALEHRLANPVPMPTQSPGWSSLPEQQKALAWHAATQRRVSDVERVSAEFDAVLKREGRALWAEISRRTGNSTPELTAPIALSVGLFGATAIPDLVNDFEHLAQQLPD